MSFSRIWGGALMGGLAVLCACSSPRAAESQHARGVRMLIADKGEVSVSPEAAYAWLLSSAKNGNLDAQAIVGACLLHGWGVKPNEAQATVWLRRAAKAGHSEAAVELALLAWKKAHKSESMSWFKLALTEGWGDPAAHLLYASLLMKQDEPCAAVEQLRAAAIGGSREAALLLADCYRTGYGVRKNAGLAAAWQSTADKPSPVSQAQ